MKRAVFAVAALLLWPAAVFGQLAFEITVLERDVDPASETIEVTFPFKNDRAGDVTIRKVETSCGCLKATADKEKYAPGESGVVTGVFSVGGRTGSYEKSLSVRTRSGAMDRTQDLRLRVKVPVLMELVPQLVAWEVGEALEPKSLVLKILRSEPIRVREADCSREGFTCKVHEVEAGREYRIEVTPGSTAEPLMGIVRVETDCEIEKHRRQLGFFSVKRAGTIEAR